MLSYMAIYSAKCHYNVIILFLFIAITSCLFTIFYFRITNTFMGVP